MGTGRGGLRTVATPGAIDWSNHRDLELLGNRLSVRYLATANSRFDCVVVHSPLGCHIWTAAKDPDGYGKFWLGDKVVVAHRFAFVRTKDLIPEGMQVDHVCRTTSCVNPDHLQLVTMQQNLALARIRAGKPSAYGRQDALNDGLAVGLADPVLFEPTSTTELGPSPWVPPLFNGIGDQIEEGWSDPRFHN